jgi:hypothetical protein
MNKDAIDALLRELEKNGDQEFTKYTNNRLATEDQMYALLVLHIADKHAKKLGPLGFEAMLQMGAICHRAIELAEYYKGSRIDYPSIVDDPTPSPSALEEAAALIDLTMMRSKKDPK